MPENISTRPASEQDVIFLGALRNSPHVSKHSHRKWHIPLHWFRDNIHQFRMIEQESKPIGFLRYDGDFIGIALRKEYCGKGIGTEVLKKEKGKALIQFS